MNEFDVFRDRIMAAENSGDPAVFEELLADDAVIQAPGLPAIEGREACLHFVRAVMSGLKSLYERQVLCESAEVIEQLTREREALLALLVDEWPGGRFTTRIPFSVR